MPVLGWKQLHLLLEKNNKQHDHHHREKTNLVYKECRVALTVEAVGRGCCTGSEMPRCRTCLQRLQVTEAYGRRHTLVAAEARLSAARRMPLGAEG